MILENIAEKNFSNGLKVLVLQKPGAPIVSTQVWYKVGSSNETSGIKGISHFLEHLMFRGSKNIKSEEHAHKINDVGGHCNAFTAEDITAYTNSVPSSSIDLVLELEAERMQNLQFDQKLFEIERNVIIEEFHKYMNNPAAKAFLEFRFSLYGQGHPYALSPLGELADLQKVSIDQLENYYKTWYNPQNAVLIIVGDIETEDAFAKAEKYFGEIKNRSTKEAMTSPEFKGNVVEPFTMKRKVDFDVPILLIGYPAPPSSHEDALALEILQIALSGGETSRLNQEVVRKASVAVMSSGMNHLLKHSGMTIFFAAFTPDINPRRVEQAILKEINRIKKDGITEKEFEKIKNSTLTNRTFDLYSAENISQKLGFGEALEGDYRGWVKRLEALKSITPDMLIKVAGKYWNDSQKYVLTLKPKHTKWQLYLAGFLRRFIKF